MHAALSSRGLAPKNDPAHAAEQQSALDRLEAARKERAEKWRRDEVRQKSSWDYDQPSGPTQTRGPRL